VLLRPQDRVGNDVGGDPQDPPHDAREDVIPIVIPDVGINVRGRFQEAVVEAVHPRRPLSLVVFVGGLGLFAWLPRAAEEVTIGPPEALAPRSARSVLLRGGLYREERRAQRRLGDRPLAVVQFILIAP
jgi:hypothetical protein